MANILLSVCQLQTVGTEQRGYCTQHAPEQAPVPVTSESQGVCAKSGAVIAAGKEGSLLPLTAQLLNGLAQLAHIIE